MRDDTCSGGWRVAALLLGVSWLVTLAVACGGGDDAATPVPSAAQAAAGSTRAGAGAVVGAGTLAPQALALALANQAAAMPSAPLQPCADGPRQVATVAAVPAHLRPPAEQDHGLSDEALKLPLGDQGASAAGVQPADPFDTQ